MKPAWEPIVLARKPLDGTVAANVLQHGTGALNIDGCRVVMPGGEEKTGGFGNGKIGVGAIGDGAGRAAGVEWQTRTDGRWPANVIHDGSDEVLAAFPDSDHARGNVTAKENGTIGGTVGIMRGSKSIERGCPGDTGSAARFFYSAKADASDRLGSKHPTVKPVDLMAYLCRLVTPPGGTVLDPFAGSGTTGMACLREGFDCILIEREAEYIADIRKRLAHVEGADTPLFASSAAYDPAADSKGCYDLAVSELRKRHEAGS